MNLKKISDFVPPFLQSLASFKSNHTHVAYTRDLHQFLRYWQTHTEIATLQAAAERFLSSLMHDGITKSSIARKISCFNSFKKFLKSKGHSVHLKLTRPTLVNPDPRFLPVRDIFQILDTVTVGDLPTQYPYRDKTILELIYATGITCSEVIMLTIGQLDFSERSIIIRNEHKKERIVFFGEQAALCIKMYLEEERTAYTLNDEPLFLNHRNNHLTSRSVQRICAMFRTILENKRNITPSILRSSYAAHLLKSGASVDEVQELLGHKTRISTERYKKARV